MCYILRLYIQLCNNNNCRGRESHQQLGQVQQRHRSVSEANLLNSVRPNRRHSIAPIDPGYVQGHGLVNYNLSPIRPPVTCFQHPHLQLRGIQVSGPSDPDGLPHLRGLSLEAGANQVLAIMSTTEKEGTLIVETISGRRRIKRGDILLNGKPVSHKTLR